MNFTKRYKSNDDKILSLKIRINNIQEHMKLITNLINQLEKEINVKRLSHVTSEEILLPSEQEDIFNTTGSFDASTKSMVFEI